MALPSSGPLSLQQINAELGWGVNLGIYRGKTFYRGNTPVVISNAPSIAEFYGLAPSPATNFWPVGGYCTFTLNGDVQPATPTVNVLAGTGRRNFDSGGSWDPAANIANFNIACPGVSHKNFNAGFTDIGGGLVLGTTNGLPSSAVMRARFSASGLSGEANLDWSITSGMSGRVGIHNGLPNFCGSTINDAMNTWQFTPALFAYYGSLQAYSSWNSETDWAFQLGAYFAFLPDTPQFNTMTITLSRIT